MDGGFIWDQHGLYVVGAYAATAVALLALGLQSWMRMRHLKRLAERLEQDTRKRRRDRHDDT